MNIIIAIDFDGTIVNHEYPKIGKLKFNAKEVINKLHNKGHKIIIWTCRYISMDLDSMIDFLVDNDIPFDDINENVITGDFEPEPKIYADIYIDDRNIFCESVDWFKIQKYLEEKGII
jgi:alpha-glucosidase (family GH31 glycosyl hydrolase)